MCRINKRLFGAALCLVMAFAALIPTARAEGGDAIQYDPDKAIAEAESILQSVPQNGSRGASYVSKVLRAGGLTGIKEKGAGDLIDTLNNASNWGQSIGTVIVDPEYSQLKKGDVLACVCTKGSSAKNGTGGHGKGKGLYYGLQDFIISEVGSDYVCVYSATVHRYNEKIRLSCCGGDFIVTCNKCKGTGNVRWVAFSFDEAIKPKKNKTFVTGWNHVRPAQDGSPDGEWYYADQDGQCVTGWQTIKGKFYYFYSDGRMARGPVSIGDKWYYFAEQPEGVPGDGKAPDSGHLCWGGFFYRPDGSCVFTNDSGVILAYDGSLNGTDPSCEYAFLAYYDIALGTNDIISCAFYDIDGDGICEFITLSGFAQADMVYTFYRMDPATGSYYKLGIAPGGGSGLCSDPKTGHLMIEGFHTGIHWAYEVTRKGNGLNVVLVAEINTANEKDRDFGYIRVYEWPFINLATDYPEESQSPEAVPSPEISVSNTMEGTAVSKSSLKVSCDFVTLTFPDSWLDRYVMLSPDAGVVEVYNRANYETGYNGHLFTIYATTRVSSNTQLLDFSIDRKFPKDNSGSKVGCYYLCKWDKGLVFALADGACSFNQDNAVLYNDYWEMFKEISGVLETFQLNKSALKSIGDSIASAEKKNLKWPYYGTCLSVLPKPGDMAEPQKDNVPKEMIDRCVRLALKEQFGEVSSYSFKYTQRPDDLELFVYVHIDITAVSQGKSYTLPVDAEFFYDVNPVVYELVSYTCGSSKQTGSVSAKKDASPSAAPELSTPVLTSVSNTEGGVQIKWKEVKGAAQYRVFRKESGENWKKIGDTKKTSFTDKTAVSGKKYTYTVRCLSKDGTTYTSSFDEKGKTVTYKAQEKKSSEGKKISGKADSIKVGDYYTFGSYEQDKNKKNGKEPIEWKILAKDGSKILVISRYILDVKAYHQKKGTITWQDCSLREWLNQDFLNDAFSAEERKMIPKVTVKADSNPDSPSADPGNDTKDYVFLLSIEEVNRYLKSDTARKCKTTKFSKRAYTNFGYSRWWLRTPGGYTTQAAFVNEDGEIKSNVVQDNSYGVRPALWIDLG